MPSGCLEYSAPSASLPSLRNVPKIGMPSQIRAKTFDNRAVHDFGVSLPSVPLAATANDRDQHARRSNPVSTRIVLPEISENEGEIV